MRIEGFLLGGSLITALLALVLLSILDSKTRQPANKPVKVPIARLPSNKAYASRSDHILE